MPLRKLDQAFRATRSLLVPVSGVVGTPKGFDMRRVAPAFGQLLIPFSLVSYVLAFWRFGADLRWVEEFFVSRGMFSRWQVWLAIAVAIQLASKGLNNANKAPAPGQTDEAPKQ